MRRDICGICGGDNTTCHTVSGTYNERVVFGYNEVVKIPSGAANIDIRQYAHNDQKDDDNFLGNHTCNLKNRENDNMLQLCVLHTVNFC